MLLIFTFQNFAKMGFSLAPFNFAWNVRSHFDLKTLVIFSQSIFLDKLLIIASIPFSFSFSGIPIFYGYDISSFSSMSIIFLTICPIICILRGFLWFVWRSKNSISWLFIWFRALFDEDFYFCSCADCVLAILFSNLTAFSPSQYILLSSLVFFSHVSFCILLRPSRVF